MGTNEPQGCGSGAKKWKPEFSQDRKVADISFLETYRMTGCKRGLTEAFLQDHSSPVPSLQIERGRAFFAAFPNEAPTRSLQARAWVHTQMEIDHITKSGASHMTALQLAELGFNNAVRLRVSTCHMAQALTWYRIATSFSELMRIV